MEPITQLQADQEEEVTLKDLIIKLQEWGKYLLGKWWMILIFGLLGATLGFTYAFLKKPQYLAELTFVLEESKSNSLGAYSGIASQFGIDIGGSSGSGVFSGDNIIEFLRSRLMVEKTLLSLITTDGKNKSLADMYLDISELRKELKPELKNITYPIDTERKGFSRQQDSVLNIIYQNILKNNLVVAKPDKKLSFIAVKCISPDERFSKIFSERLVKEATTFYVQTKTQRSKSNVDKLQEKADSLVALLNAKTYSAAASLDFNLNPARNVARVGTEVVTRDKMVLQTMYGEVVKNLEMSRMAMAQETPIIQIVDVPILPLKKEKFGKIKGILIGGILGGFLITIYLVIVLVYKKIMA